MLLSENEIDTRLVELRRRRDAVEREIADLLLYRELGRRLGGVGPKEAAGPDRDDPWLSSPTHPTHPTRSAAFSGTSDRSPDTGEAQVETVRDSVSRASLRDEDRQAFVPAVRRSSPERRSPPVPAVAFEEDPVAARRYGRAIMEAAVDALREARRPLHAGEILERVVARGFTVPGQDPVAALNTRLWKRSGPGGPLRRLGDAVYALAELAAD